MKKKTKKAPKKVAKKVVSEEEANVAIAVSAEKAKAPAKKEPKAKPEKKAPKPKKEKVVKAPTRGAVICKMIDERKHTDEEIMEATEANIQLVKRMRWLMNIGYMSKYDLPETAYLAIDEDGNEIEPKNPITPKQYIMPADRTEEDLAEIEAAKVEAREAKAAVKAEKAVVKASKKAKVKTPVKAPKKAPRKKATKK